MSMKMYGSLFSLCCTFSVGVEMFCGKLQTKISFETEKKGWMRFFSISTIECVCVCMCVDGTHSSTIYCINFAYFYFSVFELNNYD